MALSSKVNLLDTIDVEALCGANLVTLPADIRENETPVVRCVEWQDLGAGVHYLVQNLQWLTSSTGVPRS